MRFSHLFGHTLREPPSDTEMDSHRLLLRGGFIRPLAAGLFTLLPLGYRVTRRIEAILRQEMDRIGAQELLMPLLNPAEIWQATGRWDSTAPALMRLQDRNGRDYALAMTHEEVVADLARREVQSYRDLPRALFHIQTGLRDEPHPRSGLLGARESLIKAAYSLHPDAADLDRFYPLILEAYQRIFTRCALPAIAVEAAPAIAGGADSHEFMLPHPAGEERLLRCPSCGYAANAGHAEFRLPAEETHTLAEPRPVATPGCATIADVAAFVSVPTRQTLKAVFYSWQHATRDLVFVVIRGDLEVNETKLIHRLGGGSLQPAMDDEIRAIGAEPGYASPVGLTVRERRDGPGALVVADRSIQVGGNFVAGANREGVHLTGVNYPRDFAVTLLADIAQAREGHLCPHCPGRLVMEPAIQLGRCCPLGTRYAESLGALYLDPAGQQRPVVMGAYSINLGRLMAAVVEAHHDEAGIVWPPALAPFDVHLILLGKDEERAAAEEVYALLRQAGRETLYDDREESAGVKFADADLIGCPLRVTVSRRSLQAGGVEVKARRSAERQVVPVENLLETVASTAPFAFAT